MDNNELEKLKKRLYKKGEIFKEREFRSPLTPTASKAKTYWEESPPEEGGLPLPEKPKISPFRRAIIVAAGFLVLIGIGLAVYFLLGGGPAVISSKNIEISLEGPATIKGGEVGNWQAVLTNKNKTDIELADLIIKYPENSRPISASISAAKTLYERRPIGSIKAGQTITEPIKAYLFGEKDSEKKFKLTLEYRPQGSNAILAKPYERSIRLLQSPVEVSIKLPKEANAGESVSLEIEIISNAEAVISNLHLKMEYPAGFQYQESDLKSASGDDVWRLGDLESNKKRTIKIKGVLESQDQMELSFRALAGPLDEKGEVVAYGFGVSTITVKKPFLQLGIKIEGKTGEIIVSPGDDLEVDIEWQNTLPVKIYNAVIEAKIKGEAVNQRTISVQKGFYRSFDQALVWNQASVPDLGEIELLTSGEAQFRFALLKPLPNEVIRAGNPIVTIEVEMKAERITEEEGKIEIRNHISKEIKIATVFQLSRRGFYYSGPLKNTGLLPPKVGKETTYTIAWSLTNSSNNVSDAAVSAFLPSYVRWLGATKPEDANVSYDEKTGEIVWRPGLISQGTGIFAPSQELLFQISFLPNISQVGTQPVLVSETVLSGKDSFTGVFLRDVKPAQTTYLDADPQFKYEEASVRQ